jgi:hypothetical protein
METQATPKDERPNAETVGELLVIVRRLLDDERARGQGLDTKTSTLAGFTGATLAITSGFGHEIATTGAAGITETVLRVSFVVAVVALGASAVISLAVVLRPQQRLAITVDEVERFSQFPLIALEPMEVHGRMINHAAEAMAQERSVNARKAELNKVAVSFLVLGFAALACLSVTFATVGW